MNNNLMNDMLETVKEIFSATQTVIDSIATGSRKQVKEIATLVSTSLNTETSKILGFVNHYLHNVEEAGIGYVTRGKKGGFVKGPRTTKVKTPTINTAPLNSIIEELEETVEDTSSEDDIENIAV